MHDTTRRGLFKHMHKPKKRLLYLLEEQEKDWAADWSNDIWHLLFIKKLTKKVIKVIIIFLLLLFFYYDICHSRPVLCWNKSKGVNRMSIKREHKDEYMSSFVASKWTGWLTSLISSLPHSSAPTVCCMWTKKKSCFHSYKKTNKL